MGFRRLGEPFKTLGGAGGGGDFDYYVDQANGSDSNTGLSPAAAWKTLSKVNGFSFSGSKRVGLSGTFREQLTVPASNLAFGSYGGSNAKISAMDVLTGFDAASQLSDVDTQTNNATSGLNFRFNTNFQRMGQSFVASKSYSLSAVELSLRWVTQEAGKNCWVTIHADSAGSPAVAVLGTSNNIVWNTLTNVVGAKHIFILPTPVNLTSGTTYWIVLNADTTLGVGYAAMFGDNSGAGGGQKTYDGTWHAQSKKLYYRTKESIAITNAWSKPLAVNPGLVLFDRVLGTRKANSAALSSARDYVYENGFLYVYAASDPDTLYTQPGVEGSVRDTAATATGKSNLTFQNIDFEGGALAWEGAVALHTCSNVQGDRCSMRYAGETAHGIFVSTCGTVTLQNCAMEYNSNDGIYGISNTDILTILDNLIRYNGRGAAGDRNEVGVWECTSFINQRNTFASDSATTVLAIGASLVSGTTSSSDNAIDHQAGAWPSVVFGPGDHTFHHNKVLGNGLGDGGVLWCQTFNTDGTKLTAKIYQNTITNPNGATIILVAVGGGFAGSTADIRNNIISSVGSHVLVQAGWVAMLAANALDYNLYSHNTGTPFQWGATAYNFANWKTNSGQDAHSPTPGDPLFVGGSDYTLQVGSPAINAGVVIAGITDGYLGAAPDLGAYEKA